MRKSTRQTGDRGEELARKHLKKNGYKLIDLNYTCPQGEIDIIARKGHELVFLEVRTKSGDAYGTPEESITAAKKAHLIGAALHYLAAHPDSPEEWRIDVVAIELDRTGGVKRLEVIENAVDANG